MPLKTPRVWAWKSFAESLKPVEENAKFVKFDEISAIVVHIPTETLKFLCETRKKLCFSRNLWLDF